MSIIDDSNETYSEVTQKLIIQSTETGSEGNHTSKKEPIN